MSKMAIVLVILIAIVGILSIGTVYYYGTRPLPVVTHGTTTQPMTTSERITATASESVMASPTMYASYEAIDFVKKYGAKNDKLEGSIAYVLALCIDAAYQGEEITKHPDTKMSWTWTRLKGDSGKASYDQFEVVFNFETYRETSSWKFLVDLSEKKVWPRNENAKDILAIVFSFIFAFRI